MAARRPSRRQARRDAAFVLYQHDVTGLPPATLLENLAASEGYPVGEFTVACVEGVLARRDQLDAELSRHSRNWRLERLAPLERGILRLALYEIDSGVTPAEVAIDEAVRLAKRYSTAEAGSLVNGILAGALRERAGKTTPGATPVDDGGDHD